MESVSDSDLVEIDAPIELTDAETARIRELDAQFGNVTDETLGPPYDWTNPIHQNDVKSLVDVVWRLVAGPRPDLWHCDLRTVVFFDGSITVALIACLGVGGVVVAAEDFFPDDRRVATSAASALLLLAEQMQTLVTDALLGR